MTTKRDRRPPLQTAEAPPQGLTRQKVIDTKADEWAVVGWAIAHIPGRLAVVRRVTDTLPVSALADSTAGIVLRAIKEVCQRDGASMAEVVAEIRRGPEGETYENWKGELRDAVALQATADERVFTAAATAVQEGHARRLYLDSLEDALAGELDAAGRQTALDRIAKAASATTSVTDDRFDALAIADDWARHTEERVVSTGISAIDTRLGGGLPVGITAISAMPGVGKSAFAAQMMLGALERDSDLRCIWFRGEMSNSLLWSRFIAAWSDIRYPAIPNATAWQAQRRKGASKKVNADLAARVAGRLFVIDPPLTAENIVATVARLRPWLVVIDYLQKCESINPVDRRTDLDHILSSVSDMTTRHDLATIIVSAMASRHTSAKGNSDIGGLTKESNRLDYDAHNYFALTCQDKDKTKNPRPTKLIIAKARSGGEGVIDFWFNRSNLTFKPQATADEESLASDVSDFQGSSLEAGW